MKPVFKTIYSDQEFRQLLREELQAMLNPERNNHIQPEAITYMDIKQASEFLKLKPRTIYQYVNDKAIPFHKSGHRLLFRQSELAEWIKRGDK